MAASKQGDIQSISENCRNTGRARSHRQTLARYIETCHCGAQKAQLCARRGDAGKFDSAAQNGGPRAMAADQP
jgi:hypothetical protein